MTSPPPEGSQSKAEESKLMDMPAVYLKPLQESNTGIPCYLAWSTAAENVEANYPAGIKEPNETDKVFVQRITDANGSCLQDISKWLFDPNRPGICEVVIAVHGFCNDLKAAEGWYKNIQEWINHQNQEELVKGRNVVFLGYRWPAENIFDQPFKQVRDAISALPTLPRGLLLFSGLAAVTLILVLLSQGVGGVGAVVLLLLILAVGVATIVVVIVLLRLVVYFRDTYRSNYYGTPDLVDLVRQLDGAIEANYDENPDLERVKLSFLAHSLGTSVVTGAIRVLADAFEPGAVGTFNSYEEKHPSPNIGKSFKLERMVLVAPDIPVESVIPRRSNGLRSTLRRMQESHVFTNEGDLALRLASTAANFFSFPARTRFSGYRLGNLTLKHFKDKNDRRGEDEKPFYGIAGFDGIDKKDNQEDTGTRKPPGLPVKHLEIRASNAEHRNLHEDPFATWEAKNESQVTNLLSYYDCTDALDDKGRGLVSQARKVPALNLLGYARLTLAYLLFNVNSSWGVDTHGGYFRGGETAPVRMLIYRLAFAGFKNGLLNSLPEPPSEIDPDEKFSLQDQIEKPQKLFVALDQFCDQHQIQLALSLRDQKFFLLPKAEAQEITFKFIVRESDNKVIRVLLPKLPTGSPKEPLKNQIESPHSQD